MDTEILLLVCTIIAAIGGSFVAIKNIVEITGKPFSFAKRKTDKAHEEKFLEYVEKHLPAYLEEHDKQTREKYLQDRLNYLNEIKDAVLKNIQAELTEVQTLESQYERTNLILEQIATGMKNVLREKINNIFNKNKKDQTISYHEREELNMYYRDYKAMGGNSYIDSRMAIMDSWQVICED